MSSEATWRIYFVRTVSLVHKYSLLAASELTPPPRVGYAFLQYFALQGCPRNSLGWATLAQNGQKVLKKGVPPCFDQFFSKIPGSQTMLSPIFEKKWGISPRWTIRRGEPRTFFRDSARG